MDIQKTELQAINQELRKQLEQSKEEANILEVRLDKIILSE